MFKLEDDIDVEYKPGRILVDKDGQDPRTETAAGASDGRCTAVTTRGTRCKMPAIENGHCQFHTHDRSRR